MLRWFSVCGDCELACIGVLVVVTILDAPCAIVRWVCDMGELAGGLFNRVELICIRVRRIGHGLFA